MILKAAAFFIFAIATLQAAWQSPPEQFTNSGAGTFPDVAANSSGNAMAVWIDSNIVKASEFKDGTWGTFTSISTNAGTNTSSKVAFDDSGKALAIWVATGPPNSVHSAFFNGTSWSEPPISPLDTSNVNTFVSPVVAMNGSGNGLSAWIELGTNNVRSSTFNFSFWNIATTIGTGNGTVSIAENKNSQGVAVWTNGGVATANQFISNAWQVATPIGEPGDVAPEVGIDSNGKAHAVWLLTPSGTVKTSTFNGISWSASQVLSTGTGNINPHIGVASDGTAVATWIDSSGAIQSAIYNGTSWSTPVLVSNSPAAKEQDLSVSDNGNALVVWAAAASNEIDSIGLPLGGSWEDQEVVGIFSNPPSNVAAAFSSSGAAFAVWTEKYPNNTQDVFGAFTLAILSPKPPASISGKARNNSSATQTDRLHIIKFKPSTDTNVTFYRLRRNGGILAEIPATGPYKYIDHHRSEKVRDVYTLTSVNAGGIESKPLVITLK